MEECITDSELASDMYHILCIKEDNIIAFKGQSPQVHLRRYLVDWLAILCERFEIGRHALHLAVYMLDRFMDHYAIVKESQLQLLALACLLIATKYEEKEEKVQKLTTFNTQVNMDTTGCKEDYLHMELLLLDFFSWKISVPTAAYFMDFYLTEAISCNDQYAGRPLSTEYAINARTYLRKYANYFLDVSLQDHVFSSCKPSLVGAVCIASARVCLQLTPTWTSHLNKLTKYSWEQLTLYIDMLLKAHDSDEKAAKRPQTVTKTPTHNGFLSKAQAHNIRKS
ncbi:cyclin-J-like [Amphiura filiformis]|uniref:cyclin-J-like n=1 Tax=Amphiura filiformis TaxID=82378 RepID=UPI003B21B3FF